VGSVVILIIIMASSKVARKLDGPRKMVCVAFELGASKRWVGIRAKSKVLRQAPVMSRSRRGTASETERLRPPVVLSPRSMKVADVNLPCESKPGGLRALWI
jgi:hypothetical protein